MTTEVKTLVDTIRQTAFEAHVYLGHGHLEKVYENSLRNRLQRKGLHVEQQVPLSVFDEDGSLLGEYFADLVVGGLIVELKAAKALDDAHVAQILGYLRASKKKHGILINFGAAKFEIRKLIM